MRKRFLLLVATAAAVAAWSAVGAQAAGPAGAPGAQKEGLVGPSANLFCVGLAPVPGENISQTGPGFVVFNQDISANTISANVVLKGADPNQPYVIRLVQSDGSDCLTVDATLTTNGQGNGQAQVIEPIDAGASAVNVIVDTGSEFSNPTWRAPDNYTLN
jgi:hypothetical protein